MNDTEKDLIRRWVETWQRAAVELEEVKRQELRNFDYEKHRKNIDAMLQWAFEHRQERLTSGFVEQQRWFRKLRKKEPTEADSAGS